MTSRAVPSRFSLRSQLVFRQQRSRKRPKSLSIAILVSIPTMPQRPSRRSPPARVSSKPWRGAKSAARRAQRSMWPVAISTRFRATSSVRLETMTARSRSTRTAPSAFFNRAGALAASGEMDRALADYDRAIELDPMDADAHVGRGRAHYQKKDYAAAIADYDAALRLAPGDVEALAERGDAHDEPAFMIAPPRITAVSSSSSQGTPRPGTIAAGIVRYWVVLRKRLQTATRPCGSRPMTWHPRQPRLHISEAWPVRAGDCRLRSGAGPSSA